MYEFIPSFRTQTIGNSPLYSDSPVIMFSGQSMVYVPEGNTAFRFPLLKEFGILPPDFSFLEIGTIDDVPVLSIMLDKIITPLPKLLQQQQIRDIYGNFDPVRKNAFARAKELLTWRSQHKFCGVCSHELQDSDSDIARICKHCGTHYYPQLAPAVIVGILRNNGKEILLAHNKRFASGIFSLIAGFVEAGESVEQAISREILEEVGVKVNHIHYYSSQSWPYPNSLMLGFVADYVSGTAKADGTELETADWFSRENMPSIPKKGSIAREIIDAFLNGKFQKA